MYRYLEKPARYIYFDLIKRIMEEERANANSELRYIALELTKMAQKQKRPFKAVAADYMMNVFELENMLHAVPPMPKNNRRMRQSAQNREE